MSVMGVMGAVILVLASMVVFFISDLIRKIRDNTNAVAKLDASNGVIAEKINNLAENVSHAILVSKEFDKTQAELSVLKRDLGTAFKRIDELRQ